jgi:hypothetical protein
MQLSKKTSIGNNKSLLGILIKVLLILSIVIVAIIMLNKIDFPSPNKEIEKIIPNEKLKIVK